MIVENHDHSSRLPHAHPLPRVDEWWAAGQWARLEAYCARDVAAMMEMVARPSIRVPGNTTTRLAALPGGQSQAAASSSTNANDTNGSGDGAGSGGQSCAT